MKNNKIIIACPGNIATGGPELLHQLCFYLNKLKYNSVMYYYEIKNMTESPVHPQYKDYNNPYITKLEDEYGNIIVIPETKTKLLRKIKRSKKVFWWLSVDNFYSSVAGKIGDIADIFKFDRKIFYQIKSSIGIININNNDITHFVQSSYAMSNCISLNIKKDNIYLLSDYLNNVFIKNAKKNDKYKKENIVLYNPKKGYEFTKKIINYVPNLTWVPLINLTPIEMSELLLKSKVYIDFGNHPGKDRIPREAAISGCCIITGYKGAAAFKEDINIPDEFKFKDNVDNINNIITKIMDIIENYQENRMKFHDYCVEICKEEEVFKDSVEKIFSQIFNRQMSKYSSK